jgi:hypothetical protein
MMSKLLTTKEKTKASLAYGAKTNKIKRIVRGVYSPDKYYDLLEVFSVRYPKAVFSMDTLFSLYGMTDRFIEKYWMVTPRGSRTIQDGRISQTRQIDQIINVGRITFQHDEILINAYDKERLLIELFRFSRRISKNLYRDVVKYYRKTVNQDFDFNKYHAYCAFFKEKALLEEKFQKEIL